MCNWLGVTLNSFVAVAFLALTVWSVVTHKKLKPLKDIKEEDFRSINEIGRAVFISPKVIQMLQQLPRLLNLISVLGFCGFALSFIAALLQLL